MEKKKLISDLVLCFEICQNKSFQIDGQFLVWLIERRNNYLDFFFRAIYIVENTYVAAGAVVTALALLSWRKRKQEALASKYATLGILILVNEVLKPFFDRHQSAKTINVTDSYFEEDRAKTNAGC